MSFFDEYNKTTTTKKGTAPEVTPKNTPAVAPTGSFYNEFTTKKDTVSPVAPVVAPITAPTKIVSTITPPPVVEDPSSFSNFLVGSKKIASSFIADAVTTFSGLAGMPRDLAIYGTKAVKSFTEGAQTALDNPRKLSDPEWGMSRKTEAKVTPQTQFYQDIIDDLGRGKVDPSNWDTKIQQKAKQFGDELQLSRGVDPNNRTFAQNLGGGFGSMAGFFVPSFGLAKAGSFLVKSQNAAKVYKNVGGVSMVLNESFMEGNQVFQEVYQETGNVQEAQKKADNTVASNIALIGITNKYSKYFENTAPGFRNLVKSALTSAISEGPVQEGGQQLISNLNTGRPLFEGVTESAIIGSIVGGVTHMATRNIAPKSIQPEAEAVVIPNEVGGDDGASGGAGGDDKPKENIFEKLKQQIFKENKGNPIVDEYAKNDGIFTKVMTYIKSTKEVETPEQIKQTLVDNGIDEETATQMMNESVLQDIRDSAEDVTPEALQAEIDAFMGTAPSEEDTTTPPVVTETVQEVDQVPDVRKMVDSIPFDLPSMDIPKENIPKAEKDWSDNYQESYAMKQEDLKTLQKQLKNAKGESKRMLNARVNTISEQLKDMETDFLNKYAPDQAQELKELRGGEVTAETTTKLENNYQEAKDDNTPTFEPAPFNETFDENPTIFKKDQYIVSRDGKVKEVVSGNDTLNKEDPNYDANIGYIRTKDIGSEQDYLDYANQVRYASSEEIAQAQEYAKNNPIKEDTMANIEKEAKVIKKKVTQKDKVKEVVAKKEKATIKEVAKDITKPRVENAVPKKGEISVGDVLDTKGVTNMQSPVTVMEIEGRGIKFKDANGVEYGFFGSNLVKDYIKDGVWTKQENDNKVSKEEKGTTPLDNANDRVDNVDNEQGNQPREISNPSDVSTGADLERSSEPTSEVSGYDRAAMLTQSGLGLGNDRTTKLSKSQRQLINQEVEGLLEAKEYSQNPDDYTETDKDLMRAYSGAGGKESVGGEGQGLLNEYYTPNEVIGRLWTIAERLSPNMETAFEPSAGTGRIISLAPASIKVDGAEISKVSGTIATVLNPDSTITIGDFQELFFDKKTNKGKTPQQYDVVIGNPPFGERAGFLKGKGEESTINRQEEYFIKRGLDMTKDGGYLIYVVNSSFLKTKISKGKEAIAKLGGLVDAYRLPENSFEDTSIGTDIVIFKKGSTPDSTARHGSITEDTYFNQFPQHKLGAHMLRKNRFGQTESYVKGELESSLTLLDTLLPEAAKTIIDETAIDYNKTVSDLQHAIDTYGSKVIYENGDVTVVENPTSYTSTGDITYTRFKNGNADMTSADKKSLFSSPIPSETPEQRKTRISTYVKAEQEYVAPVVEVVEGVKKEKKQPEKRVTQAELDHLLGKDKKKASKKVAKDTQATMPKENATELVTPAQDISNRKTTNPVEIQMLKRIDRDMSIPTPSSEEMKYLNVGKDNKMYPDAIYFSGEVVEKLEDLKKNKKTVVENYGEAQYEKQLKGLENAVPAIFPLKDIIFDPIDRHIAQINVGSMKKFGHYGQEVEGTLLMLFTNYVRNNDVAMSPRVTKYDITRYVNGEQAAKDTKPIMGSIKSDAKRLFNHFIKHELDATIQKGIEEKYNREKNGYVNPDYAQIPVEVKDMANQFRGDDFKMSQTQKNGVGFLVNKGSGLIAYGVGVGKTHTLAIATKANMDKGWTKRPLFTVPKTTISKTWIGTLHEMFPTLKINNLEGLQAPVIARLKKERGEDPKNWIQDGEFTVISHEGLLRLGFKEDELRDAAGDLQDAIWKDESTKRAKEGQKNKFDEILGNAQKYVTDVMLSDLGFDHVSVDEVHNFRKIFQGAKPENVDENGNAVGRKRYGNVVGGTPSKRAQQLFLISQFIQKKNNNRNVFLASATPFENHATEVYNILSLVARDRMKQMGILNINDFFSVFANFEVELDRKLNGEWLNTEKMKSFSNVQALQSLIKEFIDYQEDPTLVRPERRVITPHLQMSAKQEENLAKIQNLLSGTKEIVNDTQAFDEDSKTMYDVSGEGAEDGAFLKASTYSIANSVSPYFIKEYAGTVADAKTLVEDSPKIKYTLETLKTLKEDPKTKDFGTFVFFGKMGVEYHPMIAEYFAKELGYERNQVAHLSGSVTDEQKEDIKERFNKGEIKVLLGGDQTKEGIDLQNNGFVTINLALGWNPTQIAQVEGRVWRQGNRRSIAPLVYPLVENSGDAMIYNKFEEKGGRINDLFSYAGTMFDVGEIDPAEKKLSLLTDPKDKAKMQIEIDKTILYNERVMIDNDMKALQKLRGDLNQSREDITYYKKEIDGLKDMSYMTEERKAEKTKEYKKESKNAEGRVERIEAKLKEKNITDLNVAIGEMEGQMLDIDNKIKEIDKTYEPLLEKFTAEYRENIKKRKTLSQHMDEVKGLIAELKERTPEEIKQLRNQKIAELDAIKNATPEFQRVEDTAEDVAERAKLREDATVLMLDMHNGAGTKEALETRYSKLMKRWEMLGRPAFERAVEEYTGTDTLTLKTVEKLKGKVTVSKQYISDLTNSGDIKQAERDAIREVLKDYPDATNILVKDFAEKVNASLLPLTIEWEASGSDNAMYESVTLPEDVRGDVADYLEKAYGSPIPTNAGDVHSFSINNYFAHTRTEDMGDSATRRVIEAQSDLFQKGRLENEQFGMSEMDYQQEDDLLNDFFDFVAKEKGITSEEAGELYANEDVNMTPEDPLGKKFFDIRTAQRVKELKPLEPYKNVWWERVIREEVKSAAQDGKTKLQFPTGETAMQIEGLGNEVLFAIETDTNTRVTPSRLVPGLRIVESRNRNGQEELGTRWTVTDILENGKFKAMKTSNVSTAPAKEARMIEQGKWNEIPDFMKETFDISGRIDTNNPIYKFYEKDVQRYLKNRYKAQEVTDAQGVTWVEVNITPEMAKQPIEAFQRTETTKEPTISFDAGKKRIEAYQKRLGLNFPVDFADVIFTGEYKNGVIPVKAYGVTYNDKITLTDNIKLTTADHEMVHIVVDNIDKIDAFKGITKEQLLLAQNKGRAYTEKDYERLNEELAIGFQKKVLGEEQSNVPMVIRNFYNKLQILLTDLFRALGGEVNVIKDFYNKMAVAKSNSQVNLTSSPILDRRAQYERNGVKGLDFSFQTMKEMDDIRRAGFERIVEIAKDYSIDLKRKDINYIENLFAISRDLYLKDPVEFKQADEFMKIGDSRRMKKEILDVKFSDMLAPYYDLSKSEQTDVNAVLMQGDRDTKEYTEEELLKSNLTPAQIRAYFAVRRSFNTAHQLLIDEMERTGVKAEEIETFKKERKGYMPHKWKYRFAIKTQTLGEGQDPLQKGNWKTQTMDVYETARKANKVFEQLKKDNKDPEHVRYVNDTLDALEVDFFSEQRFSFENMKSVIAKAKTGNDVKDQMIGAMRDIIKEKGFGRHFIKRTGIQGYETKEVPEIMANYFAGLNGFITKMEAGKEYYGVLEKIDARRQKNFYTWVRDSIAYDMGNTKEWNGLKQVAFIYSLANDMSFLLTNATQNWTVGVGELTKLYKNNASKIAGAEATLMKATGDWAVGNISPEEKIVIEGLLKVGRLGGEMTSELMGFKNNPIYTAMGSKFTTALYSTTAFVEKNINRVPAFLSARRILKAQGLTDKEANEQALKVSDDINFRGGKQHRPVFMRGRIGTLFVFNTYIRSFLYQLSRDLKEKEFISLTKKMFYTTLLGGTAALPFAELIMTIVKAIVGDEPEDETKDELNTWEYALKKGPINAFLNIDISSRVNINIFGVSNIIKDPLNMLSWAGAVGSIIGKRIPDGITLYNQDRYLEAFGKLMPDFIGNPLRAYNGAMYGVTTASGNPLIDENGQEFKYTTYEAYVKAFGYSPARESIAWDEVNKQWEAKDAQSAKSTIIQGKIKRQIREGDIEGAKETQAEGLSSGDITDKSTDYVKKAVIDQTMRAKYEAWNTGTKSRPILDKMERDIAKEIYGDKYTKLQLTNVTRDFAFYRTFGFDNSLANEINKAQSTAEKVEILKKARAEMTLEEFKAFFEKGRTVVKYEATSKGGENTGYVLISDSLRKAYFAK